MLPGRDFFDQINVKLLMGTETVCPPEWAATDCSYAFHKMYYFLDGECTIEIAGEIFHPQPYEMYLIPAHTVHSYHHNPENPIHKYWCHFETNLATGYRLVHHRDSLRAKLPPDRTSRLFKAMFEQERKEDPLARLQEKILLMKLLMLFLKSVPLERVLERDCNPFISMMNRYISNHLHENIMLKELADQVPLHPNYFIRYFRRGFGMTPIEYIQEMRLQRAKEMLSDHERVPIGDIAQLVGFQDYRYFSRIFKKRYGMTPSMYQKFH